MTTIVYHEESATIACDSRITNNKVIISDDQKKYQDAYGKMFFMTGPLSLNDLFIEIYENKIDIKKFNTNDIDLFDTEAMVVDHTKVEYVYFSELNNRYILNRCPLTFNFAIGSGAAYSYAALDLGASPGNAIKAAMKRDVKTGGIIRLYDIENGRMITDNE
jgi:hypothetical protein